MKTKITAKTLNTLIPKDKAYRVHDTAQPGLSIRVLPSGHASYMVTWARNKAATLGRVGMMTLDQARTEAAQYLADAHAHGEPLAVSQGRRETSTPTLRRFLDDQYYPWFRTHHKSYDKTRHAIEFSFSELMELRLSDLSLRDLESQRAKWLKAGLTKSSANRKMASLRGVLSRALDWSCLDAHPMAKLKQLKTDSRGRVRYLSSAEEKSLRDALATREENIRADRDSANKWRADRNKALFQDLRNQAFADHLLPLFLISINTGVRRGELFNLAWSDVDLDGKTLTVEGDGSKSGQTRHIQLNSEAHQTLTLWKKDSLSEKYVFPSQNGGRLDNVKKSWEGVLKIAGIEQFRWHDLRHTFASKLVMVGVPLNTVRELLGHSDLKMTLRYAHLAPDNKARAVEKISHGAVSSE